jgi:putative aldouronate transport system permease protein
MKRRFMSAFRGIKKDPALYVMFFPVLLYFVVFKYLPAAWSVIAFQDYSPRLGIFGSAWEGVSNFTLFVKSGALARLTANSVRLGLSGLAVLFPASVAAAFLCRRRGWAKAALLIPKFLPAVVVCGITARLAGRALVESAAGFTAAYSLSGAFCEAGWIGLALLCAAEGADGRLFEAAALEGAGRLQLTRYIVIPRVMPRLMLLFLIRLGDVFNVSYERVALLYQLGGAEPGTIAKADVFVSYAVRAGVFQPDFSLGAAVGLVHGAFSLAALLIARAVIRKADL